MAKNLQTQWEYQTLDKYLKEVDKAEDDRDEGEEPDYEEIIERKTNITN